MVGQAARAQTRPMNNPLYLGILFALVCAFITNLAFLFKHRGAVAAPPVDIRRPLASAAGLFRSKWFLIGWLVAAGAWVFHVLALSLAPLSVVQTVLAGGLVLLAVMADRLFGFRVGRRQWAGLTAAAVGMGLVAISLPAVNGAHSSYSLTAAIAFEGVLLGLIALIIVLPRLLGVRVKGRGLALAAAAGLMFGASGVAVKALTGLLAEHALLGLASPWLPFAALVSVTAFYTSARALQDGEAVPVIATTGTAANVIGIAAGIVVFGDPLPSDTLGIVMQAAGFVLVVAAAALMPAPVRAARVDGAPQERPAAPLPHRAGRRFGPRDGYIRHVRGTDKGERPVEACG